MSSPMIRRSWRGSALSHSRTGSRPVVVRKKVTERIGLFIVVEKPAGSQNSQVCRRWHRLHSAIAFACRCNQCVKPKTTSIMGRGRRTRTNTGSPTTPGFISVPSRQPMCGRRIRRWRGKRGSNRSSGAGRELTWRRVEPLNR